VGNPEGKKNQSQVTETNIKILREIGWNGMDWINVAQARDQWKAVANTVMNLPVP
jgi:hypothetical protein